MQQHVRENTQQWQEAIFALALFAFFGVFLFVTRDSINIVQLFTLSVLTGLLVAALRYPAYSIAILLVWLAFESLGLKFIPADSFVYVRFFPEVVIYALCGQYLLGAVSGNYKHLPPPTGAAVDLHKQRQKLILFLTLFLLCALASIIWNGSPFMTGAFGVRQLIRFLFLGALLMYIPISFTDLARVWKWLLLAFGIQVVVGLLQFFSMGYLDAFLLPNQSVEYGSGFVYGDVNQFWQLGTRVFATLGRYDRFGAFMGLIAVSASAIPLSRFFRDMKRQYPVSQKALQLYTGIFLLGVLMVFLSSSRAALYGMVLALFWLLVVIFKKRWIFIVSVISGVVLVISALYYAQLTGIDVRYVVDSPDATVFERLIEPVSQQSLQGNYDNFGRTFWLIEVPRTVVASSPVFGVGPGMFGSGTAAQLYHREVYDHLGLPFGAGDDIGVIDNSWFSLWGEFGTLGVLTFLVLIITLYQYAQVAVRHKTEYEPEYVLLAAGAQAAIIFGCVIAFFGNHFEIRTTMMLFWVLPVLFARMHRQSKKTRV